MCVNDWRAGRFIKTAFRSVELADPVPFTIAANRQRVGILIAGNVLNMAAGNAADITCDGAVVADLIVYNSSHLFTLVDHGDMPTKEFVVTAIAGASITLGITEFFLPEDFLNKGTEEWQRILLGGV